MSTKIVNSHKQALLHLTAVDPILGVAIKRLPPLEARKRRSNYFRALVSSVIGQQLSTKAADTIRKRFIALFDGQGFPKPENILAMKTEKMRAAGLSYAKISYVKNIAQAVVKGELKLRQLSKLENDRIIAELIKIKGVGRWTAEMFMMFSLRRPDVFSHGDSGLRNAIQKLYGFKQPPTVKQVEKIITKWSPYKTTACEYLWLSLDTKQG